MVDWRDAQSTRAVATRIAPKTLKIDDIVNLGRALFSPFRADAGRSWTSNCTSPSGVTPENQGRS
jgi:hypothetical protein